MSRGKIAESAARLQTGSHILVEGEVRTREYDKDGVTHRISEVYADSIKTLDRSNGRTEEAVAADGEVVETEIPLQAKPDSGRPLARFSRRFQNETG